MKSRLTAKSLTWFTLVLFILLVIATAAWANLRWTEQLPQESDFLYKWQLTRGLIFDRNNPYENTGSYRFTSPLPIILLYFPFALIENYAIARAAWITAIQVCALVFAYLSLKNTSLGIHRWLIGIFYIFALFWFPSVSIYIRGSEAIFVATFFLSALLALQNQQDEVAGILLAFATLQPRLTLLGIVLMLLWAGSQRKWRLFFWFGATLLFVGGIGMIFVSSWPLDFFWALIRNVDFSIGQTILNTTTRWWPGVGQQIGWGLIILMSIALLVEWWLVWGKSKRRLIWTLGLTWVILVWLGLETSIDHVFMLLFSLIVVFSAWYRRRGSSGQFSYLFIFIVLFPSLWGAYIRYQQQGIDETSNPMLLIGFPLILLVGLYWVRWWFLRPAYLNLNEG